MKNIGIIKRVFTLLLIFLLSINSLAAIVSDNDGSAFITKAEFDALKSNFQSQIDTYNQSIDSKIDGAIASYLSGISLSTSDDVSFLVSNSSAIKFVDNFRFRRTSAKRSGNAAAGIDAGWVYIDNEKYVTDYYGTDETYPWGQTLYYDWTNNKDLREGMGTKWDFMNTRHSVFWNQTLTMATVSNQTFTPTGGVEQHQRGHLWTVDLLPTEAKWDTSNNKMYKNLVALGRKDGTLFYPSKAYPGVACRLFTGSLLYDVLPVYDYTGNFGISWYGWESGRPNKISPDTEDPNYAVSLRSDHLYQTSSHNRAWRWHWGKENYKLYQNVVNINNHQDKSKDCTWETGFGNEDLSNLMCISDKTLYVSCVGGTKDILVRRYAGWVTLELCDAWWHHSHAPYQNTDFVFGDGVVDKHKYKIDNVVVGGPGYDATKWNENLSWDSTTELTIGCPEPLMNCKIKDLGSTVLRDNDGLTVKIGDGLPVCTVSKKGELKLVFKVTSSDNANVKLSFKRKSFQETGDYLKDKSGATWKDKVVSSGTTYTVVFPVEKTDDIIYCGILNGDNTGVRNSSISFISGDITYET